MHTLLFTVVTSSLSAAHKPTFAEDYASMESAFEVDDPDVSIVVYQDVSCEQDQLWMSMEVEAGYGLYVQLGVPEIERLESYRPSVAVLAAGLPSPPADLPFEVPDGFGALVYDTDDVDEPDFFYEPFTQTSSWVLVEETVTLPEAGPAYVVGWDPEGWTGKLWIATGTVEDFSDVDRAEFIYWGEAVNNFHETGRYGRVEPREERICISDSEATGAADGTKDAAKGCSVIPPASSAITALFLALVAVGRRTQRWTSSRRGVNTPD